MILGGVDIPLQVFLEWCAEIFVARVVDIDDQQWFGFICGIDCYGCDVGEGEGDDSES